MGRRNSVDLTRNNVFLCNLKPGSVAIVGENGSKNVTFLYKDIDERNTIYKVFDELIPYNGRVITAHRYKVKQLDCSIDYVLGYIRRGNLEFDKSNYLYMHRWTSFNGKEIFEISGKELKPFDIISVYDLTDFTTKTGLLVGTNKALVTSGNIVKVCMCKKYDEDELVKITNECERLKTLYKSMSQLEVKKEIRQFQYGDIYKKGDYISICLGNKSVYFDINTSRLKDCFISLDCDKISEEYNNTGNKLLWFRCKMSDDFRLRNIVLDMLAGKKAQIAAFGMKVLLTSNIGTLKFKTSGSVFELVKLETLKMDLKSSVLGTYLGSVFSKDDFDLNCSIGLKTYGYTEEMKKIRSALQISVR